MLSSNRSAWTKESNQEAGLVAPGLLGSLHVGMARCPLRQKVMKKECSATNQCGNFPRK